MSAQYYVENILQEPCLAPIHTVKTAHQRLYKNMKKVLGQGVRPSNSPDLSPILFLEKVHSECSVLCREHLTRALSRTYSYSENNTSALF